jgi:hypothetical protein
VQEHIKRQQQHTEAKMRRRMAITENRVDLMEGLLKKKDELVSSLAL